MQGYTAMAKDFIGWRLHNFAREKEKKMAKLKKINAFTVYTRDDRGGGSTGTLSVNDVQNFAPFCQRFKKKDGET
jgi:hypothetical protein